MRNVSRAWAYETGLAAGVRLGKQIPLNEYYEYFGPEYELDVRSSNMDDLNTPQYLERIKRITLENLRHTGGPPSVQVQPVPRLPRDDEDEKMDEDTEDLNERRTQRMRDSAVQRDDEMSDSEDEGEGGRKNERNFRDDDIAPLSPRIGGGGPSPHAARVGIMASMHMDIDDDDKIAAPPPTGPAATDTATPSLLSNNDAAAHISPDMTSKNFPDLAQDGAPDVNMDGPASALREIRD